MWRGRKTWGGSPLLQNVLLPPPHILFKHIDIRQSLMHEAFRRIGGIEDDRCEGDCLQGDCRSKAGNVENHGCEIGRIENGSQTRSFEDGGQTSGEILCSQARCKQQTDD